MNHHTSPEQAAVDMVEKMHNLANPASFGSGTLR